MTAANCIHPNGIKLHPSQMMVTLGKYQLHGIDSTALDFQVEDVIVHPLYSSSNFANDIALVKLAKQVTFTDFIQPACIRSGQNVEEDNAVIGWGPTETNDVLKVANLSRVDFGECLASNGAMLEGVHFESNYCAANKNGQYACNADSGGGMFFRHHGAWFIGGIVAHSNKILRNGKLVCNQRHYVVFTDVPKYFDWIVSNLSNNSAQVTTKRPVEITEEPAEIVPKPVGNGSERTDLESVCGKRDNVNHGDLSGNATLPGEFPWHAAIFRKPDKG